LFRKKQRTVNPIRSKIKSEEKASRLARNGFARYVVAEMLPNIPGDRLDKWRSRLRMARYRAVSARKHPERELVHRSSAAARRSGGGQNSVYRVWLSLQKTLRKAILRRVFYRDLKPQNKHLKS